MPLTATTGNVWSPELPLMQCVYCDGQLEVTGEDALTCVACRKSFPVRDGVLDMLKPLEGDNRAAANWYNSLLWPLFRPWEKLTFVFSSGGDRRARAQILKHFPDLSGARLLEVAIGDGYNVRYLPNDCRIYGVDISTYQIGNCRRNYPDRDLRLVLAEGEKLPFRDDTFDHVLSVGGFNFFNDQTGSLREMARVCKPGGRVVVADEVPNLPNLLQGRRLGLPWLDRWFLRTFMLLGKDFAETVDKHRDFQAEPVARAVLDQVEIHKIWLGIGYCFVGKPRK